MCHRAAWLSNGAWAQSVPVQFEADRVETNPETGSLTATGNVILIKMETG